MSSKSRWVGPIWATVPTNVNILPWALTITEQCCVAMMVLVLLLYQLSFNETKYGINKCTSVQIGIYLQVSRHFLLHWHDSRIHYLHILYMYYFYREQLCNQQSDHNDSKNHYFNALNWLPNGQLFFALLSIWMIKVCITVTGFWKTVICPKVTRGKKCPSTTYICVGAQKWGFTTSTMNWNFFHIRL